ncbi:hypothetical protein NQ314_003986 [Rhamnusium bicolor]|uniref:PiggyBac transposable element-derived protein domain-containing protein n=1 Tax=Rhamnusium bicolor TaxID=1586634 RepID=A0AAV8ZMT6_9CUCU|nr:hypothetical protein NQ314_003986 [Rhamnusium bicolor]
MGEAEYRRESEEYITERVDNDQEKHYNSGDEASADEDSISEEDISLDEIRKTVPFDMKNIWWVNKNQTAKIEPFTKSHTGSKNIPADAATPYDFFSCLFPPELISHITEQTKLYAQQKFKDENKYKRVTDAEIKIFLAINIYMGIKKMPSIRDYWSSNDEIRIYACGTISNDLKGFPKDLSADKSMQRGDSEWRMTLKDLTALKWKDSKGIFLASNFHNPEEVIKVQRKTKDGSRSEGKSITLKDFRTSVAKGLIGILKRQKRGRKSEDLVSPSRNFKKMIPLEIRQSESAHLSLRDKSRRCGNCSTKESSHRIQLLSSLTKST